MITLPKARYILPNLFTVSASFCGFACIWLASQAETSEHFYAAASLICLAVFLDGFDGRIARWVHGQSKFGVQLDSLSDFVTFGVAPGVLVYAWGLRPLGTTGLVIAFSLAAAAMIRLARFNVEAETTGGSSRYFTGLPAPMGGLGVALVVGVNSGLFGRTELAAEATVSMSVLVVLVALLMVSNVPFRTFKDLRPTWGNRLLIAAILAAQLVVSMAVDFMLALALTLLGYLTFNVAGGVLGVARVARARTSRDGTVVELTVEDDDDEWDAGDGF